MKPGTEVILNPGEGKWYNADVVHTAWNAEAVPASVLVSALLRKVSHHSRRLTHTPRRRRRQSAQPGMEAAPGLGLGPSGAGRVVRHRNGAALVGPT